MKSKKQLSKEEIKFLEKIPFLEYPIPRTLLWIILLAMMLSFFAGILFGGNI